MAHHQHHGTASSPSATSATFGLIEAELRSIDDDYNSGRMNAFGVSSTHDEIMKEMKKVNELELQIFYKTTEVMRNSSGDGDEAVVNRLLREHTDHTRVTSSMSGYGGGGGDGGAVTNQSFFDGSPQHHGGGSTAAVGGGDDASPEGPSHRGHTRQHSSGGGGGEDGTGKGTGVSSNTAGNAAANSMLKLTDQSFDEISKVFRGKEAALRSLAENMKEMSRHVSTVTELTQRAHEQNVATYGTMPGSSSGGPSANGGYGNSF